MFDLYEARFIDGVITVTLYRRAGKGKMLIRQASRELTDEYVGSVINDLCEELGEWTLARRAKPHNDTQGSKYHGE